MLSPEWDWGIFFQGGSLKGWQGGAGYWWGTSASLHVDSSTQRLDLSPGSWLPTERVIPETDVEASVALNDLAPEVTQCPFCSTLTPTETSPDSVSERTPQGPEQQEVRLTEPSWGLPVQPPLCSMAKSNGLFLTPIFFNPLGVCDNLLNELSCLGFLIGKYEIKHYTKRKCKK